MLLWLKRLQWKPISAQEYAQAYARFGGSVISHPTVIAAYSEVAGLTLDYRGFYRDGELVAALPAWGRYIAGHKRVLKHIKRHDVSRYVVTGNAELILPMAEDIRVPLGHRAEYLSELHTGRITNMRSAGNELAMARSHSELSKKFRYNRRRELRLMEEAGMVARPVADYPPERLFQIYFELFRKRWGFEPSGQATWPAIACRLSAHLDGYVLELEGQPVAIQILLTAESPEWISVEFINAGVDPAFAEYSPGSVLTYLNTGLLEEQSSHSGKGLRYSFGQLDRGYKARWCRPAPVYRV